MRLFLTVSSAVTIFVAACILLELGIVIGAIALASIAVAMVGAELFLTFAPGPSASRD